MARKVLITLLVLLAGSFLLALALGPGLFVPRIENHFRKLALQGKAQLRFSGLRGRFAGFSADKLSILVPPFYFSAELANPRVHLRLASLVLLKPAFTVDAGLYGGSLSGLITLSFLHAGKELDLQASGLDLTSLPQAAFIGVKKGKLSASVSDMTIDGPAPSGTLQLEIKELEIPELPRSMDPGGRGSALVAIRNFSLSSSLTLEAEGFTLNSLESSSSLGSAKGSGTVRTGKRKNETNLKISLNMSDDGLKAFPGLWAEPSTGGMAQDVEEVEAQTHRCWEFSIAGDPDEPEFKKIACS